MTEYLLQYIWKYSLYQPNNIIDEDGNNVVIINPGKWNENQGPDFLEAKIKIGNIELVGNIEIHINESDWLLHGHNNQREYDNIILHVVYEKDLDKRLGNFSTIALSKYISTNLINTYSQLMQSPMHIPCGNSAKTVSSLIWESWKDRLLVERWQMKSIAWIEDFNNSGKDWRSLLYHRLAANFGFKVNSTPFLMLAQSLPLNIVETHADNILQIEALFFGQSGLLLKNCQDDYYKKLQHEYDFLKHKYDLQHIDLEWKFLRMRPCNFPTLRIAQFAQVMKRSKSLFPLLLKANSMSRIRKLFDACAGKYFDDHYTFGNKSKKNVRKCIGESSIINIMINTIAPFQYFYGKQLGSNEYIEAAMQLMTSVPEEKNKIIDKWKELEINSDSARDTQALIQLFNNYCTQKRCLECSIGNAILRNKKTD